MSEFCEMPLTSFCTSRCASRQTANWVKGLWRPQRYQS